MTEREQLERAIAAQESLRASLGDEVVDAAIAALTKQLAELEPESGLEQRKLVTVLFCDLVGFTPLAERMDPEDIRELLHIYFQPWREAIARHGGVLDKFIGDAVMAVFGIPTASERDPENATRAALEVRDRLDTLNEGIEPRYGVRLSMRVGINTGPVLVGPVGREDAHTVTGDAVNLASRLEGAAPSNSILISHDTYRHVRGIFDVLPQEPIAIKGKAELVRTYVVQRAKPRAFRMPTRGVEGIETRIVGRDAELLTLQNTFRDAMEDAQTHVVTVAGEAGVGKSRLLYEFDNWIELLPETVLYFKGRATSEMQAVPYSIVRDMFAFRFEILESDDAGTVLEKLRAGMSPILEPDHADLVGHLVGFDFSASPVVQRFLGSPTFAERAKTFLTDYVRATAWQPVVIFFEDVHWADDSSLDLLDHLVRAVPDARLLVVCLTRPELFERRPYWGEGLGAHVRIDLKPLSRRVSRELVGEILQRVESIPDDLQKLVVDGAEGNPFYVEELIKMLIEDGVIVRGEERWWVELDRLAEVRVPPTLTGVLQARLDGLPASEKALLQRASVVGRLFWDATVAELRVDDGSRVGRDEVTALLDTIRDRELVFRRERSAFVGADEYIFKHALLRDVTYETVLLKLRRVYHGQVARWLEANAGERVGEYLGLIARHYDLAEEPEKATAYLLRAGDQARLAYAHQEAIEYYLRALAFLEEREQHERAARTLMKLGLTYHNDFDFRRAHQVYEDGFELWQRADRMRRKPVARPPAPHALRMSWLEPGSLDPGIIDDASSASLVCELFRGLVEQTPEMDVVPDVARSWEVLEGGRKYIFHLRDDVRWSDGTPVTAGDFEYAWKRVLDPVTGSAQATRLYDIRGARAFHHGEVRGEDVGVQALNEATLTVELEEPTGYFLHLLSDHVSFPVPRHVVETHGEAWTEVGNIVTNGPFKLDLWEREGVMVLVRNPSYHGHFTGNVHQVELVLRPVKEWSANLQMYEADDLDVLILSRFPPLDMDRARHRHAGEYVSPPAPLAYYVGFNVRRFPFDDVRVRRAFALATDKETLVGAIARGYYPPATGGIVPPGMPGHSAGIGLPHDPERARGLLAEAGYPGGRGFPLVDFLVMGGRAVWGKHLAEQWQESLGVDISWEAVQSIAVFRERLVDQPPSIFLMGWLADYPDPDSFLRASDIQPYTRWRPEAFDSLIEEARGASDQSVRLGLYQQADKMLIEEAVIVPLVYGRLHLLVKPWVTKLPQSAIPGPSWRDAVIEPH